MTKIVILQERHWWQIRNKESFPFISQLSSVAQSCLTLCGPMDCSMPGLPVHHQLPELAQIHVHLVDDVIQPSHPLSSPSPAFNFSQHQGLFKWSVLLIKWPEYWSFSISISPFNEYSVLISFKMDVGSPWSPRDSPESSPTPQFKIINSLVLSFLYSPTLTAIHNCWKNHSLDCCCCCCC